jgi:curved DNA-binding protein CbpA
MPARKPWFEVLGVAEAAAWESIEARRLRLLEQHHPDRGGSSSVAAEINAAFDEARAAREVAP